VETEPDPRDARRKRLHVTALGLEVLRQGEAVFDKLRDQWAQQIGPDQLESIEAHLSVLVGAVPVRLDTPGWMTRDLGESI
jgi:DNA-binding MarR family transcriptional regulator